MSAVALLIPCLNAEVSLHTLIERSLPFVPAEDIIVVDDGSTDRTASIARDHGVTVLSHHYNRGKGAALQTGFDHVLQRSDEAVITIDADLQHEPERIPDFIEHRNSTGEDVIIGSRLHDLRGMPIHRRLSNTITTELVRLRTGAAISDSQSGYRYIHRRVIEQVRLTSSGFEAETEFIIKAAAAGFRFGSVPIATIYAGEKSSMTHLRTTIHFLSVLLRDY